MEERQLERDLEWLKSLPETAYELLGIDDRSQLTDSGLRKAYRKKALQWHPDRNDGRPEAVERFREISVSYTVLSNEALRMRYDEYLDREQDKLQRQRAGLSGRDQLKADVFSREESALDERDIQAQRQQKLAALHREYEEMKHGRKRGQSGGKVNLDLPTEVRVRWKNRPELGANDFGEYHVRELMGVFGPIRGFSMDENKPGKKYHYATVEYESPADAALAAAHDYSKTGSLWDGLGMRRLASLLRSAELLEKPYTPGEIDKSALNLEEYVALSATALAHKQRKKQRV